MLPRHTVCRPPTAALEHSMAPALGTRSLVWSGKVESHMERRQARELLQSGRSFAFFFSCNQTWEHTKVRKMGSLLGGPWSLTGATHISGSRQTKHCDTVVSVSQALNRQGKKAPAFSEIKSQGKNTKPGAGLWN